MAGRGEGRTNVRLSSSPPAVLCCGHETQDPELPPPQPFPPQQLCRQQRSRLLRQFCPIPLGLRDRCPHLWPSPPLHSPHPIPSIGGSHALPLLPKRGVCSTGGTATGANRDRERPKSFASGFVSCRPPSTGITRQLPSQNSQAAPTPLPSTYFRREPTRGAAGGGQGPTASPRASGHTEPSAPSSRGTPRAPCPSHLGLCCSVSGPARRGRTVPGERRDKGGPPRTLPGPCGPFTSVFGCRTQNI